jgi:hypothetical protein
LACRKSFHLRCNEFGNRERKIAKASRVGEGHVKHGRLTTAIAEMAVRQRDQVVDEAGNIDAPFRFIESSQPGLSTNSQNAPGMKYRSPAFNASIWRFFAYRR